MNIENKKNKYTEERGVAIYIAVTVTAALILVSFAIVNISLKQISISGTSRDSQLAFYAADSGIECALFQDLKRNAFATTTTPPPNFFCNEQSILPTRVMSGGAATSTFAFNFLSGASPQPYCTSITVVKRYVGSELRTKIESRGYNDGVVSGSVCTSTNNRRVERAILVNY